MNESSQRDNDGGNLSGQYPVQSKSGSQQEDSSFFQRNGFSIFTFSPKAVVSWGMLSGIIGICISSISFYKRLGAEIDSGIHNNLELHDTLKDLKNDLDNVNARVNKHDQNFEAMKEYFAKKGHK